MTELDELKEQIEDRCENYGVLSRLYRVEVDKELLQGLIESPVAEEIGNANFDEGYALMRSFLDGVEDIDKGKSTLAIDYCLTFLGYGVDPEKADEAGMNAAYPYESIYTKKVKTLGGEHCAEVKAEYKAQGFMPSKGRDRLASDHIACELEYMQFLTSIELASLDDKGPINTEEARALQLSFIDEHLNNWIADFKDEVERHSETDFYRGLTQMTCGWIEHDRAHLVSLQEGDEN